MHDILAHPAFGNLLFCLLGLWPLARICRRVGLRPRWAGLLFANLVMPGLGAALAAGMLCHAAWPQLPAPPPRWVKTKIWGQP